MLTQVKFPTLTMDAAINRIRTGKGLKPQEQRVLTLDMEFTPSLALYIWQSFTKAPHAWGAVQYKDVANVWACAAQVCSTQGCIATSMANSSQSLPDILNLDPVQTFSADKLLYRNPSESSHPFVMPQVKPVTQNLLLFAQLLTAVAAEGHSLMDTMTAPPSSTSEGDPLRTATAVMLQGLTDGSCCTPVPLADITDAPQHLSKPSKLVVMLRSTVLISKLATLTYNVRPDGHDRLDSVLPISVEALWYSMAAVTESLLDVSSAESAAVCVKTLPDNASAVFSLQPENKEEQRLCTILIEHLAVTLRHYLKGPHAKVLSMHQKLACLQLWDVLLTIMHAGRLGPETKRLGNNSLLGVSSSACLHVVFRLIYACLLCLNSLVWRCIGSRSSYVQHENPPQQQPS